MTSELLVMFDDDGNSSVKRQKCLVCAATANGNHYGVISCAACNAFFRRSVAEKRTYSCPKSGKCVVSQEIRSICRACRLQKCIDVGMDQTAVQPHRDVLSQKPKRPHSNASDEPSSSDQPPAKQTPPPSIVQSPLSSRPTKKYDASTNVVEQLVEAYRKMNERRRLHYSTDSLRDILGGKEMTLRPVTVDHLSRNVRTEIALGMEFFNSIQPFPKLLLDDKVKLYKHVTSFLIVLEESFFSAKGGGVQSNRKIFSDCTYCDLNNYDDHYQSDDVDNTIRLNPKNGENLFLPTNLQSLREIAGPMYYCGLTEAEMLTLLIVFLFDRDVDGLTEATKRAIKDARDKTFVDLFAYYEAHGITDGPERFGNALLLIPAVRRVAEQSQENFHIVRFFNVVTYDRLLDEILLN